MRKTKKNIIPVDYEEMKRRIDAKGMSLKQAAAALGWDGGYLNRDKVVKRGGLRTNDVKYLLEILDCTLEDISPKQEIKAPEQTTRAADLTNEELIQELMKRLLKK